MSDSGWEIFDIDALKQDATDAPVSYKEFLNVAAMHCGLYHLAKGSTDMQTPHDEDELYYVLEGKAQLKVADKVTEVKPGILLYVRASEEHAFFEISEDMVLLVLFATGKR
jgi:mannose-6-phosphate isomerase-like protein (cupin superfamily)